MGREREPDLETAIVRPGRTDSRDTTQVAQPGRLLDPARASAAQILAMQRSVGNNAVGRVLSRWEDGDSGDYMAGTRRGRQKERRQGLPQEQVDELVNAVDQWTGAASGVSDRFNQYFNLLEDRGQLTPGVIQRKYVSSWDTQGGFSVEITIPRLTNWVVHAHLDSTGKVRSGANTTHYKKKVEAYELGKSVSLTWHQVKKLLPQPSDCLAFRLGSIT